MEAIKLDLHSFLKLNPNDELGLFFEELQEYGEVYMIFNPNSIPEFEEKAYELTKQLFFYFHYLILTADNKLFGVVGKEMYLIKEELGDWYEYARAVLG